LLAENYFRTSPRGLPIESLLKVQRVGQFIALATNFSGTAMSDDLSKKAMNKLLLRLPQVH
jgi:hypothetical protein